MTPEKKLILNAEKDTSKHIWIKRNQNWTADDNGICRRAEEVVFLSIKRQINN